MLNQNFHTMKKLLISFGLALGLIGSATIHAQEPTFVLPAFAYQVSSHNGTFEDISAKEGVVKLGTTLEAGADLKNVTFVATATDDPTPTQATATSNTADPTVPCFPLGFSFNISGQPMTHFVVSAFGGAYFSNTGLRGPTTTAPTTGAAPVNCIFAHPYVVASATATKSTMAVKEQITVKEGVAPACYLIEGTDGNHVLTVQHDYLVLGDEWVFQFKFYEKTGNVDFIVKDLPYDNAGTTKAGAKFHRMLLSFTEAISPSIDIYGSKYMNTTSIPSGCNHRIFVGHTTAEYSANGWETISIFSSISGDNNLLHIDADHHPEEGRTITFAYPAACTENDKPTALTPAHFDLTNPTIGNDSYSAQLAYVKDSFPSYAEITANQTTLVAVLSTEETPDFTLTDGVWYTKDAKIGNATVLANAQPKPSSSSRESFGYKFSKPVDIKATGLAKGTPYYIHLYRMSYACAGAPLYSDLCHTIAFTTPFDMPKDFSAKVPAVNSVELTAEPADGYSIIVIKSPTQKLPALSGILKKGDKIGETAEVVALLNEATTWTETLTENEGCYYLAYTVNTTNAERYFYSPNPVVLSVRAAYPELPGLFDFAKENYTIPDYKNPAYAQLSKITFRDLPYGWTRENAMAAETLNGSAFGLGQPNFEFELPVYMYALACPRWMDLVSPAFVADKDRVLVTFNICNLASANETETVKAKPAATDTIILEYAIEDGEWIQAKLFTGAELPDLNPDGYYPLTYTIEDEAIKGKRLRVRYIFKSMDTSEKVYNAIASIDIKEAKLCETPHTLRPADALITDGAVAFTWTDDNYPVAPAYTVFYKEAADKEADYQQKTVREATAVMDGLKTNTVYSVYVMANCGKEGDSYNSYPTTVSTVRSFPYAETMVEDPSYKDANGITRKGDGPFKRGVMTATGTFKTAPDPEEKPEGTPGTGEESAQAEAPDLSADLTYATAYDGTAWTPDASYEALVNHQTPNSVGIRESVKDGWLLMPTVFIEKYEQDYPISLSFKANSAYQKTETDKEGKETSSWVKGNIPAEEYAGATLYVLLSRNGLFTMKDTVLTVNVDQETIEDRAFNIDVPGFEGRAQVAFYFSNPEAPQSEADIDKATAMLLEIYDVAFDYAGDPCFPLTDLERSNTTTDEATFTWESRSASSFKISWDLASADGYANTATATEPTYTLTGLTDNTQYKVQVVGYCDEAQTIVADGEALEVHFMTFEACHALTNFQVTDVTETGATFISATDQPDFVSQRLVYVTPKNGGETFVFNHQNDTLTVTDKFTDGTDYVAQTQAVCGTDSSAMSESVAFTTIAIFDIVLKVTPAEAGTVSGEGRYKEGTEVTITATPAEKYNFIAWMNETDTLSKEATYTFEATADVTYTALFAEKTANEDLLRAAFNVSTKDGSLLVRNLKGLTVQEVIVYGLTGKKINHFMPNSREDLILPIDAERALLLVRVTTEQGVTVYKVYLH